MTLPFERGSIKDINVTAVSGTGRFVHADNIEVISVKNTQITLTSPAEHLPEQWNVPPKNINFIGRSELLKQIEDHFSQNTNPAILTACHGLGGIGKTQVALEFVWQHYKKYNGVVWFNAESRDRLQIDYIKLGRELNIIRDDDNINAEELAHRIKHWLQHSSCNGWLLVYDNADSYKNIRELLPTKEGKILITSRHTADWTQEISVDVFTIEESRAYIQKVLDTPISESNIMQIETLAETLGRLPLALAQATAYIKRNKMIISDYLEYYKLKKCHLLNSKILPSDYNASVFITWDMTMEAINKESLLASNLLNICAYLASSDIPNFLLEKFANTVKNNPNSEIFEEALGKLNYYSMLEINKQNRSSSIHRLVQEIIRINWGEERTHNLMDIFNLLMDSFPYNGKTMPEYDKKRQLLPHLEAFLQHLEAWQQEEHRLRKDRKKGFLRRFLIEIDNFYRSSGSAEKDREKDYLVPLLHLITDSYRSLGNAEKEREFLERALAIDEKHYGPDHPEVATILANLGSAYEKLGDTHKNRELLERALAIIEKHYGPGHPEVATILAKLGSAHGKLGDTQKSRELLERALAIDERHYGLEHPKVATTLANLGSAYGKLGGTHKNRELLERALAIKEKHYGPGHPEVAITLTNLGSAYGKLGDTQKNRELLERALAIDEKYYGLDHPELATTLAILSSAYGDLGDIQKKRELLERALAINERHYGLEHPKVATTLANLGSAYGKLGDTQKNRELLERALAIDEKHYGPDHPEVATILANLGSAHGKLGDTQKNRELLERALAIIEKHYGPDHPEVATILANLGSAHGKLGDTQKSRELLERALAIDEKHYGLDHPELATTLATLSSAYGDLGDIQKKRELLEWALAINERHYGLKHPKVASTLANLGSTYGKLGDTQKDRELLERALAINEKHYGPDHPEVAIVLVNLGSAYAILGDTQKKCELLERALTINEKHYGPDHPEVAFILAYLGSAYGDLGDTQKKREFLEQALAINERYYGPDHPEVVKTLMSLSNAYGSLGDSQKSLELLERALLILERHYRPDHPNVAKLLTIEYSYKDIYFSLLHLAAQYGHKYIVKALLDIHANVNARNYDDKTPLHLAAIAGKEEVISLLLDKGADVNASDYNDETALYKAARSGYKGIVNSLLNNKGTINVNAQTAFGETALHVAAINGHLDIVQSLLKKGAKTDSKNYDGETALHAAAKVGNKEIVELLLNKESMNDTTLSGETVLHKATINGHLDVVEFLLKEGAEANSKNHNGETALHEAAKLGNKDIVELFLIRNPTYIKIKTSSDDTLLHLAVREGQEEIVRFLLERGVDVDDRNYLNETPLHLAARTGRIAIAKLLLVKGANIYATASISLLHSAAKGNMEEDRMIETFDFLLKECRSSDYPQGPEALLDYRDSKGITALHLLARKGYLKAVMHLIGKGASTTISDTLGQKPIHHLADGLYKKCKEAVRLILQGKGSEVALFLTFNLEDEGFEKMEEEDKAFFGFHDQVANSINKLRTDPYNFIINDIKNHVKILLTPLNDFKPSDYKLCSPKLLLEGLMGIDGSENNSSQTSRNQLLANYIFKLTKYHKRFDDYLETKDKDKEEELKKTLEKLLKELNRPPEKQSFNNINVLKKEDIYPLELMENYIKVVESDKTYLNAQFQNLVIQRALQVIGECVSSSRSDEIRLSEDTVKKLRDNGLPDKELEHLRNEFSHVKKKSVLLSRMIIENHYKNFNCIECELQSINKLVLALEDSREERYKFCSIKELVEILKCLSTIVGAEEAVAENEEILKENLLATTAVIGAALKKEALRKEILTKLSLAVKATPDVAVVSKETLKGELEKLREKAIEEDQDGLKKSLDQVGKKLSSFLIYYFCERLVILKDTHKNVKEDHQEKKLTAFEFLLLDLREAFGSIFFDQEIGLFRKEGNLRKRIASVNILQSILQRIIGNPWLRNYLAHGDRLRNALIDISEVITSDAKIFINNGKDIIKFIKLVSKIEDDIEKIKANKCLDIESEDLFEKLIRSYYRKEFLEALRYIYLKEGVLLDSLKKELEIILKKPNFEHISEESETVLKILNPYEAIREAVYGDDSKEVKALLEGLKDHPDTLKQFIFKTDKDERGLLHWAALNSHDDTVKVLLEGVKGDQEILKKFISMADKDGKTALQLVKQRTDRDNNIVKFIQRFEKSTKKDQLRDTPSTSMTS